MFARLLGKGRFLDDDLEDFCVETWALLMKSLGGLERLQATPWVTPTPEFFPPTDAKGPARGEHVFNCIRQAMGMADWPCRLEAYERPQAHEQVDAFLFVSNPDAPNGLFWVEEDGEARIQYAADLLGHPLSLTATLAHELSHYLLAGANVPLDHGSIAHELATDLCVAFTGLGLFPANTAFEFAQHGDAFGQGWRSRRSGYLSERTWAFALALFGTLSGRPAPERWLKPGLVETTRAAERYLAKNPARLAELRSLA